jgi:subtilisin family serine protease
VVGSAPGARIWSVKVTDQTGTIMESAALCGLEWVLDNSRTIEVANLSWSGHSDTLGESCTNLVPATPQRTSSWRRLAHDRRGRWPWRRYPSVTPPNQRPTSGSTDDEVDPASIDVLHGVLCGIQDAGVTVVAAAGNDAADASEVLPAAWPEVIAVSSFSDTDGRAGGRGGAGCITGDADDTFSSFSNFGPVIALMAPGECLLSTDVDGGYAYGSGTSFATPLVAGVAAVHASRDRNATPASIRAKLLSTAEQGTVRGDTDGYQEGVLRARR